MTNDNYKYYYAENYPQEAPKNFKYRLFHIRKYFALNTTKYILLKILIGLIFFGVPIYFFKLIINYNNSLEVEVSNYRHAAIPLICSIALLILYVVMLIMMKCVLFFKNHL